MYKRTVMRALIASTMLLGFASTSVAAYDGACAYELNAVETAIKYAEFVGAKASTDDTNLLAKLEAARAKVTLSKFSDAVDKLLDISNTATALANSTKPKLTDATGINSAVIAATSCVGSLR